MRALLRLPSRATYADYIAAEATSERRHEFLDGGIVAMAGGSDEHNAIGGRLGGLCFARLTSPCRYYSPDQRFWIAATGRGRYADGSILCGRPAHPPHDGHATTNPLVVIGDDEGDKRSDFQSLASLQAYVVVAQDERRIRVYRRNDNGECRVSPDLYDGILDAGGRSILGGSSS